MKKHSLRSFAIGMLLSASIIGSFYYYLENKGQEHAMISVSEATSYLQKKGFTVLAEDEYNNLQKQIAEKKQEQAKSAAKEKKQEEPKEEQHENIAYTLKVKSGMSISQIAELLYKEKIVKDQEEFETYLIDNGYHTKIQVGSFPLTSDMSHKKIAETLTK
ncbi:hypothetical protein CHH55_17945 [Niallia circulans]|uniref:endolytic transglycosylase MltG n=1 Tax=Niallia circulans TaxID=1397 RepID=UPI000BA5DD54|nr:endolytic transglycosylase MltG [Niallia circulans]PAD24659.1 hypothetical protein CHH62_16400 [Niallia circulans]PAD86433.1 hypothetical protein CHH55_17945 [Niallia circulans]